MLYFSHTQNQIQVVTAFQELVNTPFIGKTNAMFWSRTLQDDFAEIVKKFKFT